MEERFKKMNELGFSPILNHMLMQNMHNMIDMVFTKKVFVNYKKFYVDNHD